jgi:hypothetical protein
MGTISIREHKAISLIKGTLGPAFDHENQYRILIFSLFLFQAILHSPVMVAITLGEIIEDRPRWLNRHFFLLLPNVACLLPHELT